MQNLKTFTAVPRIRFPFGRHLLLDLIVYFVLLAILPALTIGYFTLGRARTQTIEQVKNQLESVAELKHGQLSRWLEQGEYALDLVSEVTLTDPVQAQKLMAVIKGTAEPEDKAAISRKLKAIVDAHPFYDGVFLYDKRGRIVGASEPKDVGKVVRRQPYFDPSLQEANYVQPPYFDVARGQLTIVRTKAIVDANNAVVGVLAGWLDTGALGNIMLERSGLGETGETYLVSHENNYLLTPSRFDGYTMNHAYDSTGIRAVLNERSGSDVYPGYRGAMVIGVYRWLPELQVGLLAELGQDEALSLFQETSGFIGTLSGVIAIIAAGIGVFIASQIVKPITQLRALAERLSGGDLNARAEIRARNELGVLGTAFNNMAQDLQHRIEAEQTSKLELEAAVTDYMTFIQHVAEGDLTTRLSLANGQHDSEVSNDDLHLLGVNLNGMTENLGGMAVQIRETAASISSAIVEIQAAATQQMASATEQDAAITQTMATTDEVRATVTQTAERAQAVADAAQQSIAISRQGQDAVAATIQGMEAIRSQVENIAENILLLSERTQQIGEIIDTVNALADQSKLLALNASIEAARAGEDGKGFAVVAMEVRQLAEQSREATARVQDILGEIQQATNNAVMVTEEGSKGAASGMDLVDRAGKVIEELAATLDNTSQAAVQIAAITHQQINGVDQLSASMTAIKQASQQSAASTRQTEQSVQDLVEMARQMEQATARYRLNDHKAEDSN